MTLFKKNGRTKFVSKLNTLIHELIFVKTIHPEDN